jgi:hypothetical protein
MPCWSPRRLWPGDSRSPGPLRFGAGQSRRSSGGQPADVSLKGRSRDEASPPHVDTDDLPLVDQIPKRRAADASERCARFVIRDEQPLVCRFNVVQLPHLFSRFPVFAGLSCGSLQSCVGDGNVVVAISDPDFGNVEEA